jgi:hypothetical protein
MAQVVQVNRKNCRRNTGWEIFDLEGNRIERVEELMLVNCTFYVSEQGRQDTIANPGKVNRHAWIEGEWLKGQYPDESIRKLDRITYNPKVSGYFKNTVTGESLLKADKVWLLRDDAYVSKTKD